MTTSLIALLFDSEFAKQLTIIKPKNPQLAHLTIIDKNNDPHLLEALTKNPNIKKAEKVGIFINLTLSSGFLLRLFELEKSAPSPKDAILFEYGCANTHKNPHIGHLYSYIFGDAMSSILASQGFMVTKNNYQGDIGLHVAKCLWGAQQHEFISNHSSTIERMEFLQSAYQKGAIAYEDDKSAKQEIDKINALIYAKTDAKINMLYETTRAWSIEFYQLFEKELHISQSVHVFESELVESAKNLVSENIGNVFSHSDGAIVFAKEQGAPHTRVFVNSVGNVTYEAKDLALASYKLSHFPQIDKYILTTANEQSPYFEVIIAAIEKIFPHARGKFVHIPFGFVSLGSGKISSRKGAMSGYELLQSIIKTTQETNPDLDETSSKKIALSALKFGFLKQTRSQNIIFEPEKALSLQGATGPYLLYTYVRCRSILQKANYQAISSSFEQELGESLQQLILKLLDFDEAKAASAMSFSPHLLANYLLSLAQLFSTFYAQTNILNTKTDERDLLLAIVNRVANTLQEGLSLLGIETVERM